MGGRDKDWEREREGERARVKKRNREKWYRAVWQSTICQLAKWATAEFTIIHFPFLVFLKHIYYLFYDEAEVHYR